MNQAYQATALNYNALSYEFQKAQQELIASDEILDRQRTIISLQSALIEHYRREAGYVTETELEDTLEAALHEEHAETVQACWESTMSNRSCWHYLHPGGRWVLVEDQPPQVMLLASLHRNCCGTSQKSDGSHFVRIAFIHHEKCSGHFDWSETCRLPQFCAETITIALHCIAA